MSTILIGRMTTFFLEAGQILTLTVPASSTAILERNRSSVVLETISLTSSTTYGPYAVGMAWKLTCLTGSITYSCDVNTNELSSGSGSGFTEFGIVPSGTMDGTNYTFTLPSAPPNGKIGFGVYNVQPLIQDTDYTVTGVTLVYTSIRPNTANNDTHNFWY
jgi:hypothetical protein